MSDSTIRVRVPAGLDALVREHLDDPDAVITDGMRRAFVLALLTAVLDGLAPTPVADAFVRLNGVTRLAPTGRRVH